MPDEPEVLDDENAPEEEDPGEEREPFLYLIWGGLIHTVLGAIYFLVISAIAISIDLGLHWFETLGFVEKYKLSRIIGWEIELMAYTLATVDTFLFMRMLIEPGLEWIVRAARRDH